jgi:hypothetical protein
MEIEPPESTAGRLGIAAGVVAAGAALGGAAGALLPILPSVSTKAKGVLGAAFGVAATAVGAFAASEFFGGEWTDVERDTAIVGAGLVGAVGLLQMIGSVGLASAAAPPGAPQLPATSSQNYTADLSQTGGTLNMNVGDTLTVTLPGGSGNWSWAASNGGQVKWLSATDGSDSVAFVFSAVASGEAKIQALSDDGKATFVATINVL